MKYYYSTNNAQMWFDVTSNDVNGDINTNSSCPEMDHL